MNGVTLKEGRTDFGYYTDERGVFSPEDYTELVQDNRAYQVTVSEAEGGVNVSLVSEDEEIDVFLSEKIERRRNGIGHSLYQSEDDPVFPGEYDNPHNAITMYAEYAIEHGGSGISAEVDWSTVLDEENRGL